MDATAQAPTIFASTTIPSPTVVTGDDIASITRIVVETPASTTDLKKLVNIAQDFQKSRITLQQVEQQVQLTPYRSLGSFIAKYGVAAGQIVVAAATAWMAWTAAHPPQNAENPAQITQIIIQQVGPQFSHEEQPAPPPRHRNDRDDHHHDRRPDEPRSDPDNPPTN